MYNKLFHGKSFVGKSNCYEQNEEKIVEVGVFTHLLIIAAIHFIQN